MYNAGYTYDPSTVEAETGGIQELAVQASLASLDHTSFGRCPACWLWLPSCLEAFLLVHHGLSLDISPSFLQIACIPFAIVLPPSLSLLPLFLDTFGTRGKYLR